MAVFDHTEFDNHESLHFINDTSSGLRAVIAVHSTALGPAAGGCRRWSYASDADALTDALRLSRGMTYKNAVAELPFGGGKAVILASDDAAKSPELLTAFGRAVDSLGGRYVTAEDVGMSVDDMRQVRSQTKYVSGLPQSGDSAGGARRTGADVPCPNRGSRARPSTQGRPFPSLVVAGSRGRLHRRSCPLQCRRYGCSVRMVSHRQQRPVGFAHGRISQRHRCRNGCGWRRPTGGPG